MNDDKIIGLFLSKDERAISELKQKYGNYLFAIAKNILGCIEDAEECVSDVYLSLWNVIPRQKPENLKAFIGKVARNTALSKLDYNAAAKRDAKMSVLLSEIEDVIPSGEEIDDDITRRELSNVLNSFLANLPAKNRQIFVRRYYFCDSIKDIASRFGVSESKVKSLLFRMRKTLGKQLKQGGICYE